MATKILLKFTFGFFVQTLDLGLYNFNETLKLYSSNPLERIINNQTNEQTVLLL